MPLNTEIKGGERPHERLLTYFVGMKNVYDLPLLNPKVISTEVKNLQKKKNAQSNIFHFEKRKAKGNIRRGISSGGNMILGT